MDLDTLRADVKFLKIRYGLDAKGRSEGRLVIRCVFPTRSTITKLTKPRATVQKRGVLDGVHHGRHHEDVQRRRRGALRFTVGLARAHAAGRRPVADGPRPRRAAVAPVHGLPRGASRGAAEAAVEGQAGPAGERRGDHDPGLGDQVGACAGDAAARGHEEPEGQDGVVGGYQGAGRGPRWEIGAALR
eukprot:GHVR01074922.1.p1 GENE.GHVR01074922.1~~GHVR01074922.1.p1  ORF type:complete len:188 (+),score=40.23 GHVR01074922.1:548-1111(+)